MKNLKLTTNKLKGLIIIIILAPISLIAQEKFNDSSKEIVDLYNKSQSYYSTNDEIINGCVYPLPDYRIKGHPYLYNNVWNEGTFFINGNKYTDLLVKYDLILDEIILKAHIGPAVERLININKIQVDSFFINNSLFINSRNFFPDEKKFTYYELIYRGRFSIIKTYNKRFIDMYSNVSPYGKYSSFKSNMYIFNNKELTNINSVSSFLKYFDKEDRKSIKTYMKNNDIDYKNASQQHIKELMNYCTTFILN